MPVQEGSTFGVRLGCPVGQFDELATIFFGTREQSIVRLFTQSGEPFTISSLFMAGFTYILMMLLTYGCAIPAGLFMPSGRPRQALSKLASVKRDLLRDLFSSKETY